MARARVAAVCVVLAAGCAEVLNLDDFGPRAEQPDSGAGSGGAGDGGASSGGATPAPPDPGPAGSGGTGVFVPDGGDRRLACRTAETCPFDHNGCQIPTCEAGFCGVEELSGVASCVGGVQCNHGHCVDCLENEMLDPGETDVDCGGTLCRPCDDGLKCRADEDCLSKECREMKPGSPTKICFPGACNDGKLNGGETDRDCGGECQPCAQGLKCGGDADCASGFCVDGICCGVRCAGACRTCSPGTGACHLAAEGDDPGDRCPGVTNTCTALGRCSACANGRVDGTGDAAETDVDCGGVVCARCGDGKKCKSPTDCASALCEGGRCASPRCANGTKDGAEADVDCGAICGAGCGVGATCETKLDCASGSCVSSRCLP